MTTLAVLAFLAFLAFLAYSQPKASPMGLCFCCPWKAPPPPPLPPPDPFPNGAMYCEICEAWWQPERDHVAAEAHWKRAVRRRRPRV